MSTAAAPSPRRFSLAQLLLVVPWVALVIDAWAPIRDNSFLWHVRAGDLQASAGSVLTADPFSFTMHGAPWLTQSWLAELLYAWGERNWGLGFVAPMLLITTSLVFVGIGLIAHRRSRSVMATAIVLLLSVGILVTFLAPRPVIFSYLFFVLVVVAWERPSTRWVLPLLTWAWAATHGSFVLGLAYVGLTILIDRDWRWLPTAVVAGLVTLLTAHGLGIVTILLDFLRAGDALRLLSEWRRPELLSLTFIPFLIGLALIVVAAVRGTVRPRHLLLIVPFLVLALGATRAVAPSWIALLPLAAMGMQGLRLGTGERFGRGPTMVFAVSAILLPFLVASDGRLDDERFPVAAAAEMADVRTFHDDKAGGYLIWAHGPERQVYIDDRAELYGDRIVEYVAVRDGEAPWQPVFERDGIEQALLKVDEPLIRSLETAGWRTTYEDADYVVLVAPA